jgi:DNA-binding response OmpR family regulator
MQSERNTHILIVDGSEPSRAELRRALHHGSVHFDEVDGVAEALDMAAVIRPDLIVSEVRLPDASGFSLCRQLREDVRTHDLPVILVSSWAGELDRVMAFECGADDFLARPFFDRELNSRAGAVLRRKGRRGTRVRVSETRSADERPARPPAHRTARIDGRILDLTPKETAILVQLATCGGAVRSRRQLVEAIWAGKHPLPADRCIDSHVKSLRRKLGRCANSVETVRGIGYRYAPDPDLELN